jgi:hypothetical protein
MRVAAVYENCLTPKPVQFNDEKYADIKVTSVACGEDCLVSNDAHGSTLTHHMLIPCFSQWVAGVCDGELVVLASGNGTQGQLGFEIPNGSSIAPGLVLVRCVSATLGS